MTLNPDATLKALWLTVMTMLCGLIGACVGFIWGLSCGPRGADAALWALTWTAIGGVQGACVAPAWSLGQSRGGGPRGWIGLLLSGGGVVTTTLALVLWRALGHGPRLALVLGVGLLFLCLCPPAAYLFARRELRPDLPVRL